MKIAFISDIHANLTALDAVLHDIEVEGVDRTIFLGDLATLGVRPVEVVGRLCDLKCDCIMGNHDEFMLAPGKVAAYDPDRQVADAVQWCRAQLSDSDRAFIAGFANTIEFDLGGSKGLAFHGTPTSNIEILYPSGMAPGLEPYFDQRHALLVGGHTHLQAAICHQGRYLLNPGSVGAPFFAPLNGAPPTILPSSQYAVVRSDRGMVSVNLKTITFDLEAERRAIKDSDCPMAGFLLGQYR